MPLALTFPLDRPVKIDTRVHGQTANLGTVDASGAPGFVNVQFQPSPDFVGQFTVVGRSMVNTSDLAAVPLAPFLPVPYRLISDAAGAHGYALSSEPIEGNAFIQIPANAIEVGIAIACTAGYCWVYPERAAGFGGEPASTIALGPGIAVAGKVGVDSFSVSATFTRPADANAYTAGDVVANSTSSATCLALTIPVAAYAGQRIRIDKLYYTTSQATCVAQFRSQWYSRPRASLPTPSPVDNAAMTSILENDLFFKGYIDCPAFSAEAGTNTAARSQAITPWYEIQCAADDTNLYLTTSTNTAFTPDSAQQVTVFVSGVRF